MAIRFHGSRDSEVLVKRVFSCVLLQLPTRKYIMMYWLKWAKNLQSEFSDKVCNHMDTAISSTAT